MIYHQTPLYYLLAVISSFGLWKRLTTFLQDLYPSSSAMIISAAILLHPLSIDAFLGPNLLHGTIAFWLLLESLFLMKSSKPEGALGCMVLAGLCNVSYSLIPVYYFFRLKPSKKILIPALVYILLLGFYFQKLSFNDFHNPISFLNSFYTNLIFPLSMNIYSASLFKINSFNLVSVMAISAFIVWGMQRQDKLKPFIPLLFLPLIGELIYQWDSKADFWSDIIFSGSTYLCITFAFIIFLAAYVPKKIFMVYFFLMLFFSFNWAYLWKSFPEVLNQSILNLPEDYPQMLKAKRTYAWQLMYEGKLIQGRSLLQDLYNISKDEEIKKDLEVLKSK